MGKNKLKKFAELDQFRCVMQYPRETLESQGFPFSGAWHEEVFEKPGKITLELGCGKGEYTVALALANPDKNFIGVDIKGARIWKGAKEIEDRQIKNAKFLRTEIENIDKFFSKGEVDEIWITFPDPQLSKPRKRLSSPRFLSQYKKFLSNTGVIHLKTDSPYLFEYTKRLLDKNGFEIRYITDDLYGTGQADPVKSIKTFYESQWLSRGKKIKMISFTLPNFESLTEPDMEDVEKDDYRAYPRHTAIN